MIHCNIYNILFHLFYWFEIKQWVKCSQKSHRASQKVEWLQCVSAATLDYYWTSAHPQPPAKKKKKMVCVIFFHQSYCPHISTVLVHCFTVSLPTPPHPPPPTRNKTIWKIRLTFVVFLSKMFVHSKWGKAHTHTHTHTHTENNNLVL